MSKDIHGNSLYKEEYCQKMIDFFNVPHTVINNEGKEVANILPTFEKFAVSIDVHRDTLHEWQKEENVEKYPNFSDTYKKAKALQDDMVNDLAMRGFYNPTYTIFWAKNRLGMKDKQEVEQTGNAQQVVYIDADTKQKTDDHINEMIDNATK